MRKPGLFERLMIAYVVFVVVLIGLNMVLLYVSSRLGHITSDIYLVDYRKKEVSDKLIADLISFEETTKQYLLLQQDTYWRLIEEKAQGITRAWDYLSGPQTLYDEQEREIMGEGRFLWAAFLAKFHERVPDLPQDTVTLEKIFLDNETAIDELVGIARFANARAVESMDRKIVDLKGLSDDLVRFTWWALGMALSIGLIVPLVIYRSITRDLGRIKKGIQRISNGDFSFKLPIDSRDELGVLANSFNEMTARLQELDDMKSEFISIVSHELKTPLTSMKEAANLLLEGVGGTLADKQHRLVSIMNQGIMRLLRIIDELLEITRLEGGMVRLGMVQHDMNAIVAAFVQEIKPFADNQGVMIDVAYFEETCMVMADRNKIVQVLTNLTHNAIKYSQNGQGVEIRITRDSDCVTVEIEDHGTGIPEEDLPLIFDKFYQSKITRGHSGTGLGLAIAKRIVEAHGGDIRAYSQVEKGSVFVFALPALPRSPA